MGEVALGRAYRSGCDCLSYHDEFLNGSFTTNPPSIDLKPVLLSMQIYDTPLTFLLILRLRLPSFLHLNHDVIFLPTPTLPGLYCCNLVFSRFFLLYAMNKFVYNVT